MGYGDWGYRGCEGVFVCDRKDMRSIMQVVVCVLSQIKLFYAGSGWRTLTCVLVYTYAYAIGYSYYRTVSYTHLRAHETLMNLVCRKKVRPLCQK